MSEKDTLRGKSSSLCEANPQAARIPKVEASALVEELRDRVRSLERRLDEERESRRRADTIIAQLTQANAALAARVPELEAPQERPSAPQEAAQEPEGAEPRPDRPGAQEGGVERPWWRRVFGG